MKSYVKYSACSIAGCVLATVVIFLGAWLITNDENRLEVFYVDSWGRITHYKLFILSSSDSRPPEYNLTVRGNSEIMDSAVIDNFAINAISNLIHVSAPTLPNGPLNIYDGKGFVDECGTDSAILLVEGMLVRDNAYPADQPPGEAIERLYMRGMFDRHTYGMSVFRWRLISFLECWLE